MPNAYADISLKFGEVQSELNSGVHDEGLAQWGLSGPQMEPKKKGFWGAVKRLAALTKKSAIITALDAALRWGGLIVGNLSREIPGAEAIKEFIELIQASSEQIKDLGDASPPAAAALAKRSIRKTARRLKLRGDSAR